MSDTKEVWIQFACAADAAHAGQAATDLGCENQIVEDELRVFVPADDVTVQMLLELAMRYPIGRASTSLL